MKKVVESLIKAIEAPSRGKWRREALAEAREMLAELEAQEEAEKLAEAEAAALDQEETQEGGASA